MQAHLGWITKVHNLTDEFVEITGFQNSFADSTCHRAITQTWNAIRQDRNWQSHFSPPRDSRKESKRNQEPMHKQPKCRVTFSWIIRCSKTTYSIGKKFQERPMHYECLNTKRFQGWFLIAANGEILQSERTAKKIELLKYAPHWVRCYDSDSKVAVRLGKDFDVRFFMISSWPASDVFHLSKCEFQQPVRGNDVGLSKFK
jgi:hypothetical protein